MLSTLRSISILLLSAILFFSCGSSGYEPESEFAEMIGSKEVNLKRKIGSEFSLIEGRDIKTYFISYRKQNNLNTIIHEGDTIFSGKVTKFKGLYLLHKQLPNGNWRIHALNITDSTMAGLGSELDQAYLIDEKVKETKLSKAIIDSSDIVVLKPDNKTADILFYTILRKIKTYKRADYEISQSEKKPQKDEDQEEEEEDYEDESEFVYIEQHYPDKVRKKLVVKLKRGKSACNYEIENSDGDIVLEGKFSNRREVVRCDNLPVGRYQLTIEESEESFYFTKR